MTTLPLIESYFPELRDIRRDIHAHPEIGFEEVRTSDIVAAKLEEWGIEVHRGLAGTGVVGTLKGKGNAGRTIGLRSELDGLPMEEKADVPWKSTIPNRFHGCGHDGHIAILLGTARYLAETRNFSGTVHFIFQPAEEVLGGARKMIGDGLFEQFPCDEIYGMHNSPYLEHGQISIFPGPVMASGDFFDIKVKAPGGHAAAPHLTMDPIPVAMAVGQALQTITSRETDALDSLVLSIAQIHGGTAYNVIPDEVVLSGTIRTFSQKVREKTWARMRQICAGIGASFDMEIEVDIRDMFYVTINDPEKTENAIAAATDVVGAGNVLTDPAPIMGSEDFADMLRQVPGAFIWLGQRGDKPFHYPDFTFDDDAIPVGASLFARLIETQLPLAGQD